MDWLNLHTSTLDSAEFISAKPAQRSTWLCLLRYCAGQENGGTIPACGDWPDRNWQQLCRVTKREVSESCKLWQWTDGALIVWSYPVEKENEVKRNRTNGARGGRPPGSVSVNPEKTTRLISGETEQERKGKEGNRKGKRGAVPATPARTGLPSKPADLAEVVAYFASQNAPEGEAGKFFDHYEANGWRQGGRAVIRSWHSAANGWIRRWRDGGMGGEKNPASGRGPRPGAPVVPFNPAQPHAHTGGLPDAGAEGGQ